MANVNGLEYGQENATPPVRQPLNKIGKKRSKYASINTTTQAVANGDTVNLMTLPKGARIRDIYVAFGAMGASATLIIGDSGDTDRLLASTDVSAAGQSRLLPTTGFGYELTADTIIYATAGGANYAAAKDLQVWVDYLVD
jgi:hypothetical protein